MRHHVREEMLLEADHDALWSVITDYPRLVSWMPTVVSSSELVREGDIVAIECQTPDFPDESLVLELVESPRRSITFNQVDFYDQNGLSGTVELVPEGKHSRVTISFKMSVSLFNFQFKKRARQVLKDILAAAQARAQAVTSGEVMLSGRRKILEVRQKADGLEVWFRGEVYNYVGRAKAVGDEA